MSKRSPASRRPRAADPDAASACFIPHESAWSASTRRFVALSSTISSRRPARSSRLLSPCSSAGAAPATTVKWNSLPAPGSDCTQIRPPIISTRRLLIVSPRPVPP